MNPDMPFTLRIGDCNCTVIADRTAQADTAGLTERFPHVPVEELLAAARTRHPSGNHGWSYNCLLIRTGSANILIDTGHGPGGLVRERLTTLIDPADIDRVVITHGHGDHIGGLALEDGSPAYPKAGIWYAQTDLDWWERRDLSVYGEEAAAHHKRLARVLGERLTAMATDAEIAPGIRAVPAPGHTPGHLGLMIESQGERLFALVDTLHFEVQLDHPEWCPRYDNDPATAIRTRRDLLGRAADEGLLTLIFHFPYPGLGRVRRVGDTFDWTPYAE
jgi:glyoxylase-like metal-dependent hydrolase (beta-lactamase superfamily II)